MMTPEAAEQQLYYYYGKKAEAEPKPVLSIVVGIQGPGRAGKDDAAKWLCENTALRFQGTTSIPISRQIAYEEGITFEEAHAFRHERRALWRAKGDWMRRNDPAALGRLVLINSNLIVGIRAHCEMQAMLNEKLIDVNFWIDRPNQPGDPTLEFGPQLCHSIVPNWWDVPTYLERWSVIAKSYNW